MPRALKAIGASACSLAAGVSDWFFINRMQRFHDSLHPLTESLEGITQSQSRVPERKNVLCVCHNAIVPTLLTGETWSLRKSLTEGATPYLLCKLFHASGFRCPQTWLCRAEDSASGLVFKRFPILSWVWSMADNFLLNPLLFFLFSCVFFIYPGDLTLERHNNSTDDNK